MLFCVHHRKSMLDRFFRRTLRPSIPGSIWSNSLWGSENFGKIPWKSMKFLSWPLGGKSWPNRGGNWKTMKNLDLECKRRQNENLTVAEIVGDPWLTSWAMIPCHRSRTDYQDALHSAKPCNPVLRASLEVGCGNAALGPSQQSGDIWNFWEPSWVQKFVWKSIPLHQSMESSVTALLRQPEIADHVFQTLISTGHHVWCRKNWGGISGDDPGNTNPLTMWFHSNYSPHISPCH